MKTTRILSAVSAAALLGISSFALAQGPGGGAGSSGSTMQKQEQPSGATGPGSTSKEMNRESTRDQKGNQAQQGKEMGKEPAKSQAQQKEMGIEQKSQAQQKEIGREPQKSQAQQKEMDKTAPKAAQSPAPTDSKSKMGQDSTKSGTTIGQDSTKSGTTVGQDSTKSGTTVGAAPAGAVNLTTEQRTTIRQSVLTASAPRATNINFAVNVGTVVPSSVRVVAVPDVLVRIHPAWRGYRYFVYNDEIIIVEPRTLKIVAVLDV